MDINLLDLAKGYFSGGAAGALASALGEKEEATSTALGGVLPALLGGLMQKSTTSSGASTIFNMLDDADDGMLDNVLGMFSGGKMETTKSAGSGILSSLFGHNLGPIAGTIAKMSGLGKGSSSSLLSLAAPIIMGLLKKTTKDNDFDASGLAGLLAGQADHLKGAAPAALFESIGLGGLGDLASGASAGVEDVVSSAGSAASGANIAAADGADDLLNDAAGASGNVAATSSDITSSSGSLLKKLLPILLIAAAAFFGWKACGSDLQDGANSGVDGAGSIVGDATGDMVDVAADAAGNLLV